MDQINSASLEVEGFKLMVNYVRTVEKAMGTGEKVILDEEREIRKKARSIKFIVIIDETYCIYSCKIRK